jgi:hypothetical protein
MRAVLVLLAAVALAGCESTQSKSARLERAAKGAEQERGLVVGEQAREVEVVRTTVLQDANCDALYPRGAAFCSQCAHPLMR